jgi:hypothetical protein
MSTLRNALTGIALTSALVVGGTFVGPTAKAVEAPRQTSVTTTSGLSEIESAQLDQAIDEARAGGYVTKETVDADGAVVTTLDLGDGLTFDLVATSHRQRIGAGSDSKGVYVSFNATDQNMIISGSAFALGAAVCAVSGGTFCVVVGAILTAATVAITGSGAIRCGTKHLRVYPFAGGRVKPRCV